MNDFLVCPICAKKTITNIKNRRWECANCGFELYNNVATAVGLLIFNKDGKLLLEKRAKEPRKNFYAFPGGFVDFDESAEQACVRECQEELGVTPLALKYLCSFPNDYEYKRFDYKTCDLFFTAQLPDGVKFNLQETEVAGLEWFSVKDEKSIDEIPLAFESAKRTLKFFLGRTKNGES
ncbi:NUDIX hydrolase [Treponema pectinovorum]|uniref:NUDIX hydrolase n=1 Tax=Treponema pectinovorum TaxID=164 RepID=UPI0011F2C038|nr:NUDIX domain-containing protein [Treponema pectinovorum]